MTDDDGVTFNADQSTEHVRRASGSSAPVETARDRWATRCDVTAALFAFFAVGVPLTALLAPIPSSNPAAGLILALVVSGCCAGAALLAWLIGLIVRGGDR